MTQAKPVRAPEVPLTRAVIALFTAAVVLGLYYVAGGPVPYTVHFGGPTGAAFEGRYAVTSVADLSSVPPGETETFNGVYPHTLNVWGSRRQSLVASSQSSAEVNALNTITVRRAGIVCNEVYRWGTEAEIVCE